MKMTLKLTAMIMVLVMAIGILPAIPVFAEIDIPEIEEELTYSPTQKLSDIQLPTGWTWANPSLVPNAGEQEYDANYSGSTYQILLDIMKADPDIEFEKADGEVISKLIGTKPLVNKAISNSDGKIIYSVDEEDPNGANIAEIGANEGEVYAKAPGEVYIFAETEETQNYESALTYYILEVMEKPEIPEIDEMDYDPETTLADIELPDGWRWGNPKLIPQVKNNGYAAFFTDQSDEFEPLEFVVPMTVLKAENAIWFDTLDSDPLYVTYGTAPLTYKAKTLSVKEGTVIYRSTDTKVATVSSKGIVTTKGQGQCEIIASALESNNYFSASESYTLIVEPRHGWIKKNGKQYYYRNNVLKKDCWVQDENSGNYYRTDKYGAKITGGKVITINYKKYLLSLSGIWQRGTKRYALHGKPYMIVKNSVPYNRRFMYGKNTYVSNKSGILQQGRKIVTVNGKKYYVGIYGKVAQNRWVKYKKNWYYASKTGYLITGRSYKLGKKFTVGTKYVFDQSGRCLNK